MPPDSRSPAEYAILAQMDALTPEDIKARALVKDISERLLDELGEPRVLATCCRCLTDQWARPGWPATCGFCGETYSRRIAANPGSTP